MKTLLPLILFLFLSPQNLLAQSEIRSLDLDYCYDQLEREYPLYKQIDIRERIADVNDRILRNNYYPELQLKAAASYQSQVTEIPFSAPGTTAPELSKDHYQLTAELSQTIYDGGKTSALRKIDKGQRDLKQASIIAELWNVRTELERIYFSILILQKQSENLALLYEDLQLQLENLQSKISNGIVLPANARILEAEILNVKQFQIQNTYDQKAGFDVLGELIGEELTSSTELRAPKVSEMVISESELQHPELNVFTARNHALDLQKKLTVTDQRPKVSAYGMSSYGRPGLNVFENDLQAYWLVGLKAQWSFRDWKKSSQKREALDLEIHAVETEAETFRIQIHNQIIRIEERIKQLREQLQVDEQILKLREEIADEKSSQLAQGLITSTEYITELNNENKARLNLELHQVQLYQSMVELATKKGISWN